MTRRGSLLTVLIFVALVATLAFALVGLSIGHLSTMSSQNCRQEALNLARSAVSQAIERLMVNPAFGTGAPTGQYLNVELAGTRPGSKGLLTFEATRARELKIPVSVNNLSGTHSVVGSLDHTIAGAQAQLIGVGTSGGMTQRVVVYLAVPAFPYAIASAGPVRAEGGVTVGGLAALPEGPIDASVELLPTSMISNNSGDTAIFLGANTTVTGDVKAAGKVKFDPAAPVDSIHVDGMVRSGVSKEKIPHIPLSDYDPQALGKPFNAVQTGKVITPLVVSGLNRRQGSFEATEGLQLAGGLLFVDGNLNVSGGLTGKGIVVATGNITISGQAELVAANGLALLAGHDFRLGGGGSDRSYLQGLVYTEGKFQADQVTLVGTLISGGSGGETVTLRDTRLLKTTLQPIQASGGSQAAPSTPWGVADNTWIYPPSLSGPDLVFDLVWSTPWNPQARKTFKVPLASLTATNPDDLVKQLMDILAPQITEFTKSSTHPYSDLAGPITTYLGNTVPALVLNPNPPDPGGPPVVLTLDPSSFLRLQDRIRIVLWSESE